MTEVTAPGGRWRGQIADGIAVFRGVRYARAERFAAPEPCPGTADAVPAVEPGPIAPQLPSRLEGVMGAPEPHPWSEDCLNLTVTAPATTGATARPVLVWIHGGAYLSGSGGWRCYDAQRLVRETGIVVVSINYRLGALGYLRAPGVAPGNLGLLDQITALEWVRDNIGAFGGDPGKVTVAGQSAGGQSIAALLGIERTAGLFQRAILQSAPLGLPFHTPARAEHVAEVMLARLGTDPQSASIPELLRAQAETVRHFAGPGGLNAAPPFLPIAGADPLPDTTARRAEIRRRASGLQVIAGHTAHEMAAFHVGHPVFDTIRRVPVAGPRIATAISNTLSRKVFETPMFELADELTAAGARVHCYRIPALHPANPLTAGHCIELPLLFGDEHAWRAAPMLNGIPPAHLNELGARMRRQWGELVTSGTTTPRWAAHTFGSRDAHRLP
ncbi:carboxylesterase family protein [Nocardia sp. NPDC101769]|uniref:carboxylesterase family protein n=1 Tax=Nocardia sp. NPDC101769 TaxID=3364333 RepID=UPI00380CF026